MVKLVKAQYHIEKKTWGWEEWIVNNDLYCGKRLHFDAVNGSTSLHFHINKHETMYVEKGEFDIIVVDKYAEMKTHHLFMGDSLEIKPGTVHRIVCRHLDPPTINGEAVIVEFSTHHENSDSYRVAK